MSTEDKVKITVTEQNSGSLDVVYFAFGKGVVASIVDDGRCAPPHTVTIHTLGGASGYKDDKWRFATEAAAVKSVLDYFNAEVE